MIPPNSRAARRRCIADYYHAGVWAGLVVLCDGDHRPFPHGGHPSARRSAFWIAGLVLLAVVPLSVARRFRYI